MKHVMEARLSLAGSAVTATSTVLPPKDRLPAIRSVLERQGMPP